VTAYRIRRAAPQDEDAVLVLLEKATSWLAERGSDQWQSLDRRRCHVQRDLDERTIYLVETGADQVATITVDDLADSDFWLSGDAVDTAVYVHRMVVARDLAGRNLGSAMLDWAGRHAQRRGKSWVRLDAWRTNAALHGYYRDRGFDHVRTRDLPWRGSGVLFQRPAAVQLRWGPALQDG
jgi:GNAT superfamily N-acetyltransferase